MEASNRPVTGYPATAVPYAAPPTNGYHTQNNPYYQPHSNAALRRVLAFIIGFIVFFAAITFITWLVLRPQLPEFRVDSLSVSNFSLGNDSTISFTSEVHVTAENPNRKMSLSYDHLQAEFFYESWALSHTMIPPFSQDKKNKTYLTGIFAAASSFIGKSAVEGINSELGRNGNLGFNLRVLFRIGFKAKVWMTKRRFMKVFCGDLVVGIPSNRSSATLTGGPRRCRVGI